MSVNQAQLVKSIQTAVAASPELQKQLAAATSTDQAAGLLTNALGSPVSVADLQNLGASVQSQMTDEQLEVVSAGGGLNVLAIVCSVLAVASCAAASVLAEVVPNSPGCKEYFKNGG
jgi:hypothetical protein